MEEHSMPKIYVGPRLRSLSDQLVDPFRLIIRQWAPLLLTQAIIYVVSTIITVLCILVFFGPIFWGVVKGEDFNAFLAYLLTGYFWLGLAFIVIPSIVLFTWGTCAMITAIGHKDGMAPIGGTFKKAFQVFIPFLILSAIVCLAYLGASLLLFFPFLILSIGLSMCWYIRVLEDVSIFKAMGTSWQITKGYKWSILGRFLLLLLVVWGVSIPLALAGGLPLIGIAFVPAQILLNLIITPYALAYFYCIYEDLRAVRKDVYPLKGGISVFMVICWLIGAVVISGLIFVVYYMIEQYVM